MDKSPKNWGDVLKPRFYYRIISDKNNNFNSKNVYMQVNCTGFSHFDCEVNMFEKRKDYYLLYITSGILNVKIPQINKPLIAGNMIIFSPDKNFSYSSDSSLDFDYFWVHFTGHGIKTFMDKCGLICDQILTPGINETIFENFLEMFKLFEMRDELFDAACENKLTSILYNFSKSILLQKNIKSKNLDKMKNSISYIHKNIIKNLSIKELAKKENMSISLYRGLFHKTTGVSPQEYIIISKLTYACELIRQTDLGIKEVSWKVGYQDQLYFSRIFKKRFGLTPSEYKNSQKN